MSDGPQWIRESGQPGDALTNAAIWLYILAAIITVGAIAGGAALITHSIPDCTANPYDTSLLECGQRVHPFVGPGWGLLVGGLAQAGLVCIIAWLCNSVAKLQAAHGD